MLKKRSLNRKVERKTETCKGERGSVASQKGIEEERMKRGRQRLDVIIKGRKGLKKIVEKKGRK